MSDQKNQKHTKKCRRNLTQKLVSFIVLAVVIQFQGQDLIKY